MRRASVAVLVVSALWMGCSSDPDDTDGGVDDASTMDAGGDDAGVNDAGTPDGSNSDGGATDGGTPDGSSTDGGGSDGGVPDGSSDAGVGDAGVVCPTAVATAWVFNSTGPPGITILAEPLDNILLDGTGSSAVPGKAISQYQWTLSSGPEGYIPTFTPNSTDATTAVQITLPGVYVFELLVIDDAGTAACAPARIDIEARGTDMLFIALTWTTAGDPDESDVGLGMGTDVDLHLLEPGGTWNDPFFGTDIHFRFTTAEWGAVGTEDNPLLERDDTDGAGPEVITVDRPAPTTGTPYSMPYEVGVYFFDDHGFGEVSARVRIWEEGGTVLVFDLVRTLTIPGPDTANPTGDFWHVGSIDWTLAGGTYTPIDVVSSGFP